MDIQEYVKKMKKIQLRLLAFIEEEDDYDKLYEKIAKSLRKHIIEDDNLTYETLHLIVKISNNHFRCPNFFKRIEFVIYFFKDKIKQTYSNQEIFHIFKSNKRLLLYLFNQEILTMDEDIIEKFKSEKYKKNGYFEYFMKETDDQIDPKEFERLRLIGENESYICQLIREDSVEDFIIFMNKKSIPISKYFIKPTIFETNSFLLKRKVMLIEYSAFYGSIQIFKYLFINRAFVNYELWYYVIHGKNPDLVHFLEENKIEPKSKNYEDCLKEAIKCHHNDIAEYIHDRFSSISYNRNSDVFLPTIQYFNYAHFNQQLKNKLVLFYACKYDYVQLVMLLVKNKDLDPNSKIISKIIYFFNDILNNPLFEWHFK